MPDTTVTSDVERVVEKMDDPDLVFCMLAILMPSVGGAPITAGCSVNAASAARTIFIEIASRWIPADVFGQAWQKLQSGQEDDDA